jgi:hypothetical protein
MGDEEKGRRGQVLNNNSRLVDELDERRGGHAIALRPSANTGGKSPPPSDHVEIVTQGRHLAKGRARKQNMHIHGHKVPHNCGAVVVVVSPVSPPLASITDRKCALIGKDWEKRDVFKFEFLPNRPT